MGITQLQKVYDKYKVHTDTGYGDKGTVHDYINIYSGYIDKSSCKVLLEVGVNKGHSIKMWEEYLPASEIIGVDINLSRCEFSFQNAKLIECDATSENLLNYVKNKTFDIIIDDGSHILEHQIKTFELLFPLLNKGGYYFIEDVISGNNERVLLSFLKSQNVEYKIFRPIEKTGRYDDILILIYKQ
jgi:cephalosporin hydroxylase